MFVRNAKGNKMINAHRTSRWERWALFHVYSAAQVRRMAMPEPKMGTREVAKRMVYRFRRMGRFDGMACRLGTGLHAEFSMPSLE